ncbi:MAG: GntR family transcriptional regulator [Verrucomicrobiota bacterium]
MASQRTLLYEQVRERLLGQIQAECQPGDLLPTQQEIAKETGASMITVKRAIQELAREGLVRSIPGKGTIVQQPVVADLHAGVSSWTESVSGFGEIPGTAWTRISEFKPSERLSNLLEIPAGATGIRVQRLRTVGGRPICLMINEASSSLLPGLKERGLGGESFYYALLRDYGIEPVEAYEEVRCRTSKAAERKHLGEAVSHVLEVRRRSFDAEGEPVELATVIARPDRYRYQVKLFNKPIS